MATEEIKSWMEQEQEKQQNKYITLLSDIHQQDWSPDQSYSMGHRPIKYVSTAKMKRTIAPIFDKNGQSLEMSQDKDFAPIIEDKRVVLRFVFRILIDGVVATKSYVYGEGQNDGKQFITAQTNAYRTYCLSQFATVDGMEDLQQSQPQPAPKLIRIEGVSEQATQTERDSTLSQDAPDTVPDTPKSEVSGVWRRQSEGQYRQIMSAPNLPQEERDKATSLYNAISNNADAKAFVDYKQRLGL